MYEKIMEWYDCEACKLCDECFYHVVFNGTIRANTLVLTYLPDEDDDALGEACSGRKRTLFREMLSEVKRRTGVRLLPCYTPRIACKPKKPSDVHKAELEACKPRVDMIVDFVKPELIIEYGKRPAMAAYVSGLPTISLPGIVYDNTTEDQLMLAKRNALLLVNAVRAHRIGRTDRVG